MYSDGKNLMIYRQSSELLRPIVTFFDTIVS